MMNEKKFQEIYNAWFKPLCRFLNLYTKDKDVISDVIQEVFCNLWTNRDFLEIKHIRSYLYTSTRNRVLNYIRNEKLHAEILNNFLQEEKELQNAYECVDKEEFADKLEKVIEELPQKCKNVFKLSRYHQMSYKQIANQEGISEKMVEKHISVALKKIKEKVKDMYFILL